MKSEANRALRRAIVYQVRPLKDCARRNSKSLDRIEETLARHIRDDEVLLAKLVGAVRASRIWLLILIPIATVLISAIVWYFNVHVPKI